MGLGNSVGYQSGQEVRQMGCLSQIQSQMADSLSTLGHQAARLDLALSRLLASGPVPLKGANTASDRPPIPDNVECQLRDRLNSMDSLNSLLADIATRLENAV